MTCRRMEKENNVVQGCASAAASARLRIFQAFWLGTSRSNLEKLNEIKLEIRELIRDEG